MTMEAEHAAQLKTDKKKLLSDLSKEDKVKIRAICFIRPLSTGGMKTFKPGEELEVAKSEAKEFCERKFNGYTPEPGTKPSAFPQTKIVRAEYVR